MCVCVCACVCVSAPHRSPLQLPRGCVLLIDELSLSEGKLTETGVKSLQALQGVLLEQVLRYDFEYCANHPFPVDTPVVVLSQGKSLMGDAVAVRLPLVPDTPLLTEAQVRGMCWPYVP